MDTRESCHGPSTPFLSVDVLVLRIFVLICSFCSESLAATFIRSKCFLFWYGQLFLLS